MSFLEKFIKNSGTLYPTNRENILLSNNNSISTAEVPLHFVAPVGNANYLGLIMQPANYGTDYNLVQSGLGVAERFYDGYGQFNFPDNDGSPRPNIVHVWGYNTAPAGGRVKQMKQDLVLDMRQVLMVYLNFIFRKYILQLAPGKDFFLFMLIKQLVLLMLKLIVILGNLNILQILLIKLFQ